MDTLTKVPQEVLDYLFDWATALGDDTISTSTMVVPSGLTADSDSKTTTTATVWISGGTAGTGYTVTNRIVTTDGRTLEDAFRLLVVDSGQDPALTEIDAAYAGAVNCYATVESLRRRHPRMATENTATVLDVLHEASRHVDMVCNRHFHPTSAVRYIDVLGSTDVVLLPDDLLSVTEVATDPNTQQTYDETWTAGTDYLFEPDGDVPYRWMRTAPDTLKWFPVGKRRVRVTGVWGYGDGERTDPWMSTSGTTTLADATGTAMTVTGAAGLVQAGQTIRVEDEQIFVQLVSGADAIVVRGANGTTAAAHTSAAIELPSYPSSIRASTLVVATEIWNLAQLHGFTSERAGDWNYTVDADKSRRRDRRILARYIRRNG